MILHDQMWGELSLSVSTCKDDPVKCCINSGYDRTHYSAPGSGIDEYGHLPHRIYQLRFIKNMNLLPSTNSDAYLPSREITENLSKT